MPMIPISDIKRRTDARPLDHTTVAALAESIVEVGLINPIRVRADGDGYEVIAGGHRFAAHQQLGFPEIECIVVTDDDLRAELAMIDENLCRAELSPSDRARQTARRKAIYEELHPETKHGANQSSSGQFGHTDTDAFTEATAKVTGQSERKVRRDAERGEKVIDEVLDMIRGTSLDTGMYLDQIKRLPPNDQVAAAKRDLAARRKAEKQDAESKKARAEARQKDAAISFSEAERFAEWLMARTDLSEIETLVSWLQGTKPKDVIAALRRLAA